MTSTDPMSPVIASESALQAQAERFVAAALRDLRRRDRPALASLLLQFLPGVEMRARPGIGSARLRLLAARAYALEIDPEFARLQLCADDDALFVLLHELMHKAHGDLHRVLPDGPVERIFRNFALDILVNAHLVRLAFDDPPKLLARLYPATRFPACLLAPPPHLARALARREGSATFDLAGKDLMSRLASSWRFRLRFQDALASHLCGLGVHNHERLAALYLHGWVDPLPFDLFFAELVDALARECPGLAELAEHLLFLGDHDPDGWPFPLLGDWRALDGNAPESAGHSRAIEHRRIRPVDRPDAYRFFEALRAAIDAGHRPADGPGLQDAATVVGWPDRRGLAFLAAGVPPVFYQSALPGPDHGQGQAHVYLDASGSTSDYHALMCGLVLHLGAHIGSPVHLFSNVVVDASLDDLRRGDLRTTGGTDFDCVIRHALEHRFRRILLVTDGVAELSASLRIQAEQAKLDVYMVYTNIDRAGRMRQERRERRSGLGSLVRGRWTLDV